MKTNFWKSAAAFVVGMAAMVACEKNPEPENEAPVFPSETIEKNVEAGETVNIQFTANLDWELSIPSTEQTKYWLDDAGMPASKVSGKAGEQTVSVVFSEDEYYDENLLCEVTLTMGGQSQVIAKLTRLAINRALEVYVAEKTEWNFKSTYGTEKVTALALATFEGDVTYTLPIKVVANYDWSLALPTWCEGEIKGAESLSGKAGQAVEVLLTGKLAEDVKNGAEGVAKFIDATDNAQSMDLALTLPAFASRVDYLNTFEETFEADGSSSKLFSITALDGLVFKTLEFDGQFHSINWVDWVTFENQSDSETTDSIFKEYFMNITAKANTSSSSRVADLFAFPASVFEKIPADDLSGLCVSDDVCSIKEEYEQYRIGRIIQKGETASFLTLYNNLEDEWDQFNPWKSTLTLATETNWWTDIHSSIENLGENNKYTLTYSADDAVGVFTFAGEYASYKIYDYYLAEVSKDAEEDFWLTYFPMMGGTLGRVNMDPSLFVAPDNNMDGQPDAGVAPEAFIVFFDESGNALAAVHCKYEVATSGSTSLFTVTSGYAEVMGLSGMGMPDGTLNSMISGLGAYAEQEKVIMASSQVVEFTTGFNFSQVFIIDMAGNMLENTSAFSVYQSSNTSFKVTAANESAYLLVFMDSMGNVPVVVYYNCYY